MQGRSQDWILVGSKKQQCVIDGNWTLVFCGFSKCIYQLCSLFFDNFLYKTKFYLFVVSSDPKPLQVGPPLAIWTNFNMLQCLTKHMQKHNFNVCLKKINKKHSCIHKKFQKHSCWVKFTNIFNFKSLA